MPLRDGELGSRAGSKLPLLIGTLLASASFTLLAVWHDSQLPIHLGTSLMGLGIGFAFAANGQPDRRGGGPVAGGHRHRGEHDQRTTSGSMVFLERLA